MEEEKVAQLSHDTAYGIKSAVGYSGEVCIKYVDNKTGEVKTLSRHNAGGLGLFSFLAHCIQDNNYKTYYPQKIMLYNASGEELLASPASFYAEPTTFLEEDGSSTKSNTSCNTVQLIFNIPAITFKQTNVYVSKLRLLNDKYGSGSITDASDAVCAYVTLTEPTLIKPGVNLIVYWKLHFESLEA